MGWKDRLNAKYQSEPAPVSSTGSWKERVSESATQRATQRRAQEEEARVQNNLKLAQSETARYIDEYNKATSGFAGSILKRFGIGVSAPTLVDSPVIQPVTQSDAYQQAVQYSNENDQNLSKSVGTNVKEVAKSWFTENTTDTLYDTVYNSGVDKEKLSYLEKNTKTILELRKRNETEPNAEFRKRRQVAIDTLIEQNKRFAEEVGGEIKDKNLQQLIGQSVGTVLELLPPTIGAGMTKAGAAILASSTSRALKSLGKEAALYGGSVGVSEKMKEKDASLGEIAASGAVGALAGIATISIPGLLKLATKKGSEFVENLIGKISKGGKESLTPDEIKAVEQITEKKQAPEKRSTPNDAIRDQVTPEKVAEATSKPGGGYGYTVEDKKKLYTEIVEPKIQSAGKLADDEVYAFRSGKITDGDYVNTDIDKIWGYPVDKDFDVIKVKRDQLQETGNADKDAIGYRIFKESKVAEPQVSDAQNVSKKSESPILKEVNKSLDAASKLDENLPTTTFKKQFALAEREINADTKKAYNRAVYGEGNDDELTQSSLQLMLLKNAMNKGDNKAIAEIGMAAAKTGRKAGQTSVMFRSLYDQDPMSRMLLDLARRKLANVEARYPKILRKVLGDGDDIVVKTKRAIKNKAKVTQKEAQQIIDEFICK